MPGEEDFGIAPVEANACGRPVIAFAAGGALDTQRDGETGVLFPRQTVQALCDAVERAEKIDWDVQAIRAHAEGFQIPVFQRKMEKVISDAMRRHKQSLNDVRRAYETDSAESHSLSAAASVNGYSKTLVESSVMDSHQNCHSHVQSGHSQNGHA